MAKRSDFQNENDGRLRLLYLYRILEQYTDAEHPMTTGQIRDMMKERHGIYMHRTTVYYDIELLKTSGIDVRYVRSRSNKYYIESRKFEIPEIRMLLDAVESSRFLTEEQSRSLSDKLMTLTSETGADKLKRNLLVTGNIKGGNRQIFYIIDAVNEAINKGKRISFQYIEYNAQKKMRLRHKGRRYTVSPYSLIWNGDYYYLVGYYHEEEEVRTFRVDRIYEQPLILGEAPIPEEAAETADYASVDDNAAAAAQNGKADEDKATGEEEAEVPAEDMTAAVTVKKTVPAPEPEIETDALPIPEDFDISRYTREVFRMYDTEEAVKVTLVCDNDIMKGVLDAFGMDIKVHWAEKGKFKTTVKVCASPTFFAWVFQWQGKVKIARPEKVVEEYREMARKAFEEE